MVMSAIVRLTLERFFTRLVKRNVCIFLADHMVLRMDTNAAHGLSHTLLLETNTDALIAPLCP